MGNTSVSGFRQWGFRGGCNHSREVMAGEEQGNELGFPMDPPPPESWLPSFTGDSQKMCI